MDVQTVDSLRPRYPAHLLLDAPVVIPTRERLLRRLGERMGARRDDLDPTAAREVAHLPAQPRQLAREVGGRREDGREHLHTRPRELRGNEPRAIPRGEHLLHRRGQPARDAGRPAETPPRPRPYRAPSRRIHPPSAYFSMLSARSGLRLRLSALQLFGVGSPPVLDAESFAAIKSLSINLPSAIPDLAEHADKRRPKAVAC